MDHDFCIIMYQKQQKEKKIHSFDNSDLFLLSILSADPLPPSRRVIVRRISGWQAMLESLLLNSREQLPLQQQQKNSKRAVFASRETSLTTRLSVVG